MRRLLGTALVLLFVPRAALAIGPRLDRDVWPTFESVELTTDPDRPDYTGRVRAEIDVKSPVDHIRLHARELTVTSAVVRGPSGDVTATPKATAADQVTLQLPATLAPGHYTLVMEFQNQYSRRAAALYRVQTGGHSYLFTQFEATEAREAFPCWDEPEFKFPWQLQLTVPAKQMAVSNTPIEKTTPAANGMKAVLFRKTKPLPSYLIAIAVGPFEAVPIRGMPVPGNVICVQGAAPLAKEAAQAAGPILNALVRYFGRPYPYEKLDLIAAPEFLYGAMENAGAIVFADKRLLIDAKSGSAGEERAMRSVIAHEMAHQWFGDLVTMRWWDDLWLNESFATWMAAKVMDEIYPQYRSGQNQFEGSYRARETDARPSTGAMRQPIASEDNLSANANELTYNKGQAMLAMFEGWVGPAKFRAGVLEYLKAHEWSNAKGDDLWSAISHASGQDISTAMSSFLDQPGVPYVTIDTQRPNRVVLRQQPFKSSGDMEEGEDRPSAEAQAHERRWRVPVILGIPDAKGTKQLRVMLTSEDTTITLPMAERPTWILPNSGSSGYYVWNQAGIMLEAMANDHARLTPAERIGFIRNLILLERSGELPAENYLPLLRHFRDDPEPEVVVAMIAALEAVREPLVSPDLEPMFADQVRQLLGPAEARMGLAPKPGEMPAIAAARPRVLRALGDLGQDHEVRQWADAFTAKALQGAAVDPALAEAAFPIAAQHGNATLMGEFEKKFEGATIPTERAQYLTALGNFRDPAVVKQLLDYTLKGPLRPQEVITLPTTLAEWPDSRDGIYRWMTTHYAEILKHIPSHMVSRMMPIVRGCSEERLKSARTFFADAQHTFPGASFVLARTGDAVDDCTRTANRDAGRFSDYLKSVASRP